HPRAARPNRPRRPSDRRCGRRCGWRWPTTGSVSRPAIWTGSSSGSTVSTTAAAGRPGGPGSGCPSSGTWPTTTRDGSTSNPVRARGPLSPWSSPYSRSELHDGPPMTDRRGYPNPHDARPLSVLLAEDEESFVDALVVGLGHEGFKVTVARDGLEALQLFEETGPDLVLLDLMLPKMSGIDVCRSIRAHSAVPIIMVTAKGAEIDTVVALEVGADDYVTKPYRLRELVARMRAVMRRTPSHTGPGAGPDWSEGSVDEATLEA